MNWGVQGPGRRESPLVTDPILCSLLNSQCFLQVVRVVFEKGFLPQNQKLKKYILINSFKLKKKKFLNLSSMSSADLLQAVNSYPFPLLLQACLGQCRSSEVLGLVSYLCRKRYCVGRLSFRYGTVTEA